jgi:hypothetical protein
MFRLLQRMDDATPRSTEGGGGGTRPLLKPLTVLAAADETPAEAVESWARGLDWVQWMFSSIRNRMQALYLEHPLEEPELLLQPLTEHLLQAWRAAEAGDADALQTLDGALSEAMTEEVMKRSQAAGVLLLRSTRGARYQGVLGRYRRACEEGATPGHFLTVWAAVGHFFQLAPANLIAEYLRLELAFGSGLGEAMAESPIIARLTSSLLRQSGADLRLFAAAADFPDAACATTPT